jgi:hypothetical protein
LTAPESSNKPSSSGDRTHAYEGSVHSPITPHNAAPIDEAKVVIRASLVDELEARKQVASAPAPEHAPAASEHAAVAPEQGPSKGDASKGDAVAHSRPEFTPSEDTARFNLRAKPAGGAPTVRLLALAAAVLVALFVARAFLLP